VIVLRLDAGLAMQCYGCWHVIFCGIDLVEAEMVHGRAKVPVNVVRCLFDLLIIMARHQ
jgi:hypothetical protein